MELHVEMNGLILNVKIISTCGCSNITFKKKIVKNK